MGSSVDTLPAWPKYTLDVSREGVAPVHRDDIPELWRRQLHEDDVAVIVSAFETNSVLVRARTRVGTRFTFAAVTLVEDAHKHTDGEAKGIALGRLEDLLYQQILTAPDAELPREL